MGVEGVVHGPGNASDARLAWGQLCYAQRDEVFRGMGQVANEDEQDGGEDEQADDDEIGVDGPVEDQQ